MAAPAETGHAGHLMKPAPADPQATLAAARERNDPRLDPWFIAPTDEEASRALAQLLEEIAEPVLTRVIREKFGATGHRQDAEDIIGEARLQIIRRLQRLREAPPDDTGRPLIDFQAYVASVAYTTWALTVRRRNPARAALVDRLRYLLEGRTQQRGFALWAGQGGKSWAGFEAWRGREQFLAGTGQKVNRLLADSHGAAAEIFGPDADWERMPLPEILVRLFTWLGEPLPLRDLTDVVARWQGIPEGGWETLATDAEETPAAEVPATGASPHDELRWKEYLGWLLGAVARLTRRQRTAFLLHSSCLHEMEQLGLTGIRQTASLLDLPAERMAEHWPKLPLEDRGIASILGLGMQNVINERKTARAVLGRAWQCFLQGNG